MLCGLPIPTPKFLASLKVERKRRRQGQPLKISGPIHLNEMQPRFRNLQVAGNSNKYRGANALPQFFSGIISNHGVSTDTDDLYVNSRQQLQNSKTLIYRRPVPLPPTPSDNFDGKSPHHEGIPPTPTLPPKNPAPSPAYLRTRPILAIKTGSPMSNPFDTLAPMKTPLSKYVPIERFRNSWRERSFFSAPFSGRQSKGKEKVVDPGLQHQNQQYPQQHQQQMQRRATNDNVASGPSKHNATFNAQLSADETRVRRLRNNFDLSELPSRGGPNDTTATRSSIEKARELIHNRRHPDHTKDTEGPRPGQLYEIVERQVIEDNPNRTVTISTWREQVAQATTWEEERMSVYYINADQYAREGEMMPMSETVLEVGPVQHHERSIKSTSSGSETRSRTSLLRNESFARSQAQGSSVLRRDNSGSHKLIARTASRSRSHSDSKRSSGRRPYDENKLGEGKSKPDFGTGPKRDSLRRSFSEYYRQESTPVEKALPPSPFHPTRSGSTISSIKSISTSEIERVLSSCEPSLLHIRPQLAKLGITRMEHLRAIAKLTPRTRDREVKEHALKFGITVVEWAILLDKIFTL